MNDQDQNESQPFNQDSQSNLSTLSQSNPIALKTDQSPSTDRKTNYPKEDDNDESIDIQMTVQQGSFLPIICLINRKEIDPSTYIVDGQTGATVIHYASHFGKIKAIKTLVEEFKVNPALIDYNHMNLAHYAARSGELSILKMFKDRQDVLDCKDLFGFTPVHYTLTFNRVYSFIYLYFKVGHDFNKDVMMQTLFQMTYQNDCQEILQILMHLPSYREQLGSIVLLNALRSQNFRVFKLLLRKLHTEITDDVWKNALEIANTLDVYKDNFKRSIQKYMYRQAFTTGKRSSQIIPNRFIFWEQFFKHIWKNVAMLFGSLIYLSINTIFVISCISNRHLKINQQLHILFNTNNYDQLDKSLIFMILGNIIAFISMITMLLSDPGYIRKRKIEDSSSVINTLLGQFDSSDTSKLIPLDEICFSCLVEKKEIHSQKRIEHCKKCDKCVKTFHTHSAFFNKCIGYNNARSFGLFIFTNYWLVLCYLIQLWFFTPAWENAQSSNVLFKFIEIHIMPWLSGDFKLGVSMLALECYMFGIIDQVVALFVAIGREVTVNELNQPWNYKYNFEIVDNANGLEDKKKVYQQRHVSICRSVWNIIKFFLACRGGNSDSKRQVKKSSKVSYIEMADMSRVEEKVEDLSTTSIETEELSP